MLLNGIVKGSLQARALQDWQRVEERATERTFARAAHHPLECDVPQRDQSPAVDDGDPLIQRFDRFLTAVLVFNLAHVRAVGAMREEQRERGHRQHFPQLVIDDLDKTDGEAGADDVMRAVADHGAQPQAVDRLPGDEWHDHAADRAVREGVDRDREQDRHPLPRPLEVSLRSAETGVHDARGVDGGDRCRCIDECVFGRPRPLRVGQHVG